MHAGQCQVCTARRTPTIIGPSANNMENVTSHGERRNRAVRSRAKTGRDILKKNGPLAYACIKNVIPAVVLLRGRST